MKTLNRPMFRMGGPIKQGIMHGIREPYRGGGAALVGDPRFPKDKTGRAHHVGWIPATMGAAGRGIGIALPHIRRAGSAFKNLFGKTTPASVTRGGKPVAEAVGSYSPVTMAASKFTPNWLGRDPVVGATRWGYGALTNPTAKGLGKKALRIATSPSTLIGGAIYGFWPDGTPKEGPDAPISVPLNPNLQELQKKTKADATANAAAFAKEQRNNRVEKYLKMMGYDSAKKTAIADALIDASKIVSDRGTLDRKNITAELINPAIQAFSKRLDKPQQIREAVGLMATKAEIEKDLEDPTVKALRMKQLEKLDKELSPGVGPSIMAYMATKKDDIKGKELVDLVRLAANQEGTPFKFITQEEVTVAEEKFPELKGKTAIELVSSVAETDGVYMVGDAVIEIKGGIPKQIK